MTKKQVKEYLSRYRECMARVQRLRIDAEQFSASADSIKKEIEGCIIQSSDIERLIFQHCDLMEREILTRKYIYGETLELIAERLNYSVRHIQRIIDRAAEGIGEFLTC